MKKLLALLLISSPAYATTTQIQVGASLRQIATVVSSTVSPTLDTEPKEIIIQKNKIIIIYQ